MSKQNTRLSDRTKAVNITLKMIAEWFELSSVQVLYSTTAKEKYLRVIDKVVEHVNQELKKKLL